MINHNNHPRFSTLIPMNSPIQLKFVKQSTNDNFTDHNPAYQWQSYYQNLSQASPIKKNTKDQEKLGRLVRVAWQTALNRQTVHIKNPENKRWKHEPPGGPSTPLGDFWKFPKIQQSSTQLRIHIAIIQ